MATLRARGYGGEAGTANSKFRTIVEIYSEDNGSNGHNIWVQRYIQVTRGDFRGTVIATSWGGSVSVRGAGNYAVSGLVYVGVLGYGGSNTQSGHSQYIASNITRRSDASTSWTAPRPTYTVYYNANGGTGAPSSQTKTYGYILTLSDTVPKREGYIFLGWSKSASATNPTYYAGGQFGEAAKYEKKPPITKDKEKTVNINFRFKRSVFILTIETKAFFSLLSTANDSGTWNLVK